MILTAHLTNVERSQLERKELARGAWREGQIQKALVILEGVSREDMTPRVAGEVFVTEAAFRCAAGEFVAALQSLERAAPHLAECDARVNGAFYFHRALAHRNLWNIDAALTDYAGRIAFYQEAGDVHDEIAVRINLAELYLIREDVRQAHEHINLAFILLTPDSIHFCNAHDTMAKVLAAQGELAEAVTHAKIAIDAAGENEQWKEASEKTLRSIKAKVLEAAECVFTVKDLKCLQPKIIQRALVATNGSIIAAAKLMQTSHQHVAYVADTKQLERSAPRVRRKSIIKLSS